MLINTKKWILLLGLLLSAGQNLAIAEEFNEGFEYELINPPVKTGHPDKVVVTEIFWYGCPHCFSFEPFVDKWLKNKPADVIFQQVPSVLNASWSDHARAYFALEMMGAVDKVHKPLFTAIHKQKKRLNSVDTIADFVAKSGVDEKQFRDNYYSFPVDSKVRKAKQLERKIGHRGVPAVVINGKYRTSGAQAGSYARMLKIIDSLVAKELAALK